MLLVELMRDRASSVVLRQNRTPTANFSAPGSEGIGTVNLMTSCG
jgi:hypothetical protein